MLSKSAKVSLVTAGVFAGGIFAATLTSFAEDSELDRGPRAIPYNGILEFNGQSLNGDADIQFTLSTDDNNACPDFMEPHENVPVYAGRFSVNIGSVDSVNEPLPGCLFDAEAVYLQMSVRGGDEDTPHILLAGRQRINPVPFAYWAAEGSNFRVDGNLTTGSASIASTATAGRLELTDSDPAEPMLAFNSSSFDNDANLAEFSDYKLLLYPNSTPETSYGFGIQGGTLFANSDGAYDFKVDGLDEMTLDSGGLTVTDHLTANGGATVTGNITATGGANITGNITSGSTNTGTLTASKLNGPIVPAYAAWASQGLGGGGAGIYNEQSANGLMVVGNNSAGGSRKVTLYDNVTVAGNLNTTGSVTSNAGTLFNVPCAAFQWDGVNDNLLGGSRYASSPMNGGRRIDFYCSGGVLSRIDLRF